MNFLKFCRHLLSEVDRLEAEIDLSKKLPQRDFNEILQTAKAQNIQYLKTLLSIKSLSSFDIGFLMSSVELTKDKIATVKQAVKLYDDKLFNAQGQTLSDFIFRVCANLDVVNSDNLDVFKELAKCKNEIYDFSKAMKNPIKHTKAAQHAPKFEFVTVFY